MTYTLTDINESYTDLITDDIQFKKKVIDTLSVFEEGYKFSPAFRARIWDGKKHFYKIVNNNIRFPKGLVEYVIKDLVRLNLEYYYNTTSEKTDIEFSEFEKYTKTLGLPFEPYDYQLKAAYDMIKDRRGVMRAATSAGKSLIIYIFIRYMLDNNKKCILVVPSIGLVNQMYSDFKEYNWTDIEKYTKQMGGEHKGTKDLSEKPLIISTWQTLQHINSKEFDIFDSVISDECHTISGDTLDNILKNAVNAKWKLGLTGTIPRAKTDKLQLLGTLGRIYQVINSAGLISRNLAADLRINCIYMLYNKDDIEFSKKNKFKYPDEEKFITSHIARNWKVSSILNKLSLSGNSLGLFSKTAHGELLLKNSVQMRTGISNFELIHKITPKPLKEAYEKFLEDKDKVFYINKKITDEDKAKIIKNISKITDDYDEFVKSIKSLDDINIFFYTGIVDGSTREYIRKKLEDIHAGNIKVKLNNGNYKEFLPNENIKLEDGNIKIASNLCIGDKLDNGNIERIEEILGAIVLGNWSVISTGISVKNIHNIVYCSSLKSYTKVIQSIGRLMRKHSSKEGIKSNIFDIIDDITIKLPRSEKKNYVLKHFYERLEYYREEGYELREKEICL